MTYLPVSRSVNILSKLIEQKIVRGRFRQRLVGQCGWFGIKRHRSNHHDDTRAGLLPCFNVGCFSLFPTTGCGLTTCLICFCLNRFEFNISMLSVLTKQNGSRPSRPPDSHLHRLCCTKLSEAVFDGVDGTAVALANRLIGRSIVR